MKIEGLAQLAVALVVLVGATLGAMAYFASAAELNMVERRLDQKIMFDSAERTQDRMWTLEDRNKHIEKFCDWPQENKDEYRRLEKKMKRLDKKLDAIMEKSLNNVKAEVG